MKSLLLLFFLLLYPSTSFAEIDERKTDVYFANGISTKERTAIDYSDLLKKTMIDKFGMDYYNQHINKVSYAYNSTHGDAFDLAESLDQKLNLIGKKGDEKCDQ
jgi:formylmethanofuran dehydrogenase subunit E-like metal-binding protein